MTQCGKTGSNLTMNQGFRNADFYLPHRAAIQTWVADFLTIPHSCAATSVFLLESGLSAKPGPAGDDFMLGKLPVLAPYGLFERCREIGIAQKEVTVVLSAECAASASQYAEHFGKVIVAGPLEQLHIALHAKKLAAFLNNEHWWACFLTNAEETHVFYDPRRRGG